MANGSIAPDIGQDRFASRRPTALIDASRFFKYIEDQPINK
jgi:hypothetical protein